jgi:lipoprotein-anchoring transpeptidase ErfK/SrfK
MRTQLFAAILAFSIVGQHHPAHKARPHPKPKPAPAAGALPCGDPFAFQVLLDRQNISPGQIDGKLGVNFSHAVAAAQAAHKLPATGEPDCALWHALGDETAGGALTTTYEITDADLKGPFEPTIPRDLEKQASLPALAYSSPIEELGERFHVAPALLQEMNPGVKLAAGASIKVPAVTPFDPEAKAAPNAARGETTLQVSRDESAARVLGPDNALVFFAPVTTGSEHDPLPPGSWKVTSVDWHPPFHYNPALFWDANPAHSKATIKPGPNNPVGVVWIGVSIEHYGIHGTPEPSRIGYTQSHGCVRLTNWDAARLASLVKPGTPVVFR